MRGKSEYLAVNFIGFQVYWWLCILYGDVVVPICISLLALHLYFHSSPRQEFSSIVMLGTLGFAVDSIATGFGLFAFAAENHLPPLWLLMLWLGFATNITTLTSQAQYPLLIYLIAGSVLAPVSYLAAFKLGAVDFPFQLQTTWITLATIWAVLLPSLVSVQLYLRRQNYAFS